MFFSSWRYLSPSSFQHQVTLPPNCVATIDVPGQDVDQVTESGVPAKTAVGVTYLGPQKDHSYTLRFKIVSGTYSFQSSWNGGERSLLVL